MAKEKKPVGGLMKILIYVVISSLYILAPFLVLLTAYGLTADGPIFLLWLLLPYTAEVLTARFLKYNPFVLMTTALWSAAFYAVLFISFLHNSLFEFFYVAIIMIAVRFFIGIIQCVVIKKKRAVLIMLCLCVCFSAAAVFQLNNQYRIISFLIEIKTSGERDKLGSWSSINQQLTRGEDWQEYVTDTPFSLGEIRQADAEVFGEDAKYCDLGTYPNIDGSTVCVPMAVEFARQHLNFEDLTANQFVSFSTTHYAYENLMDTAATSQTYVHYGLDSFIELGSVDLVLATEPSDEELALAGKKGITLIKQPVCYDAFVFITHKDNPVDSLTVDEIKKIYSGEITNWKDVGGKSEKIRAFQREKNSGSQTAMENLVMKGEEMTDPIEVKVIEGMGELVDAVAEYENETASIGYTYRYYIDTLYKNDNIKTLSVNGIAPTDDNIRKGLYPYTTNYYGVIRKGDEDKVGGRFLQWILSEEGQKCVSQAGYITL